MNHKTKQLITTILTIVVFLLVVIDGAIVVQRCDFTADNTYRISDVTKNTLRSLDEKVTLSYYICNSVIKQTPFGASSVDLLKELEAVSKGNLDLEIIDPIKEEISKARLEGLQMWQLQSQDSKVSVSAEAVYSGIVIKYGKKREVIPVIHQNNYQQIEYDVISTLRKMNSDQKMEIGIIIATTRGSEQPKSEQEVYRMGFSALVQQSGQIFETFEFEEIEVGAVIDKRFTAVVVVGAELVDEVQLLILDQYLMNGGALLYVTEKDELFINPMNQQMPLAFTGFNSLPLFDYLKHYGVEFEAGKLMDSKCKKGLTQQMGIMVDVFKPIITRANKDYSFNNNFAQMQMMWPDALKLTPPGSAVASEGDNTELVINEAKHQIDVLLESSSTSAIAQNPDPQFVMNPNMSQTLYSAVPKAEQKRYPVAARVFGEISSYFSDYAANSLPVREGEDPLFDTINKSTDIGQFIVISDTEFLTDFALQSEGQNMLVSNLRYLGNVAEYLGGDREMLKVRTKIPGARMLNKIDGEEKEVALKQAAFWLNVIVLPIFMALFALIWLIIRHVRTNGSNTSKKKKDQGVSK